MENESIKSFITDEKYQVFVLVSPAAVPVHFFYHAWFVTIENGVTNRWEIFHVSDLKGNGTQWGHLYRNFYLPFAGMHKYFGDSGRIQSPDEVKLVGHVSGDVAQEMIACIKSTPETYPYTHYYRLVRGPNSNAYAQWVLNKFPAAAIELPWRALGRGYRFRGKA